MDSTTATSGVGPLLTLCLCCHDSPFVRSVFLELAGLCQGRRVRAVVGFTWTCENRSRQWRDFFSHHCYLRPTGKPVTVS